jgi:glyoxylase-like metal-dependent hydrolase (beta-lactamase superfamily II)
MTVRRWEVGDVRITSVAEIEDAAVPGDFVIPASTPETIRTHEWLVPAFATPDGLLRMRIQMLVVESQGRRIAVDTCLGNDKARTNPFFSMLDTTFLDDLTAAGFPPESIDTVVCTHLHVDHVGWNTRLVDGRWVPTFPNARYLFGRVECAHWDEYGIHEDGDVFGDSVRPILEAGLADLVEFGHRVTDEVVLEPTPGHSPGHQSVHVTSGSHEALITGDVLHHPVQCCEPAWASAFDSDAGAARRMRREVLARYAGTDVLVIGTHFAGPGAGRVTTDGDGWRLTVCPGSGRFQKSGNPDYRHAGCGH